MQGVYYPFGLYIPTDWLIAVATSDVRLAVYRLQALYPIVRFAHILGTALFLGPIAFLDLRLIGLFRGVDIDTLMRPLLRCVHVAFVVVTASGAILFLYNPIQTGSHTMFAAKLVLLALGVANAWALHHGPWRRLSRRPFRSAALVSLGLWVLVVGAATWNATERPLRPQRAADGIDRYVDAPPPATAP